MTARVFGAALDFLDDPERLGLKLSYARARGRGLVGADLPADPYDALAPLLGSVPGLGISLRGKLEVPGWLTPRPGVSDLAQIRPQTYRAFMDQGGPARYVQECKKAAAGILPEVPVLIAVDHSLAAGPISAASNYYGPESLAVVVLDAHFDALPARDRAPQGTDLSWSSDGWCGDFLSGLVEQGVVKPDKLFVVGVCDFPESDAASTPYGVKYRSWLERGVRVYPRDLARAPGFAGRLGRELLQSRARALYVSLDADVGACSCMNAVRFMDAVGLDEDAIMKTARALSGLVSSGRYALAGMDVSEIDVHLLGLPGPEGEADRTAQVCARFITSLLA